MRKNSGIGGQAVMEGIMMRNGDSYAVAVRKPDQDIACITKQFHSVISWKGAASIPILRGVVAFIDSLRIGMTTLMYSASFFEEEEEGRQTGDGDRWLLTLIMAVSILLGIAVFMVLPYALSALVGRLTGNRIFLSVFEAVLRVVIFLVYMVLISRMKDIQRTYEYHGAEHKCINCIESGLELTVENVMKSSRFHKRCGTSFLFLIIMISAVLLMFVRADSHLMRIVIRLLLVPLIAGISYEFIRLAGRSENPLINLISKPGLAMQRLTTREPDEAQVEVAIAAVEEVFDWRGFLRDFDSRRDGCPHAR